MLDKVVEIGLLYDFYGKLLTDKQQETMTLYYYEDLSLAEIAERMKISRQGVYDHLHRSEETLKDLESKLGLIKKYYKLKDNINNLVEYIVEKELNSDVKNNLIKKIEFIKEQL